MNIGGSSLGNRPYNLPLPLPLPLALPQPKPESEPLHYSDLEDVNSLSGKGENIYYSDPMIFMLGSSTKEQIKKSDVLILKTPRLPSATFPLLDLLIKELHLKAPTQIKSEKINRENEELNEKLYDLLNKSDKKVSSGQEAIQKLENEKAGQIRVWEEKISSKGTFLCYAIKLSVYNRYESVLFSYVGNHLSPFMRKLLSMHALNHSKETFFLLQFLTWNAALDPMKERQLAEAWEQKKFVNSLLEAESALKMAHSYDYRIWFSETNNAFYPFDICYAFNMGPILISKKVDLSLFPDLRKLNLLDFIRINRILAGYKEQIGQSSEPKKKTHKYEYQLILSLGLKGMAQSLEEKAEMKKLKCKVIELTKLKEIKEKYLSYQEKKFLKKLTHTSKVYLIAADGLVGEDSISSGDASRKRVFAKDIAEMIEKQASHLKESSRKKSSDNKLRIKVISSFGGKEGGPKASFCQHLYNNLTEKGISAEVSGYTGPISRLVGITQEARDYLSMQKKGHYQSGHEHYKPEGSTKVFSSHFPTGRISKAVDYQKLEPRSGADMNFNSNIKGHFLNLGPLSEKECEKLFNQELCPLESLKRTPFLWTIRQDLESPGSQDDRTFVTMYSLHFQGERFKHIPLNSSRPLSLHDLLSFLQKMWNDYSNQMFYCKGSTLEMEQILETEQVLTQNLLIQQALSWVKQDVEQAQGIGPSFISEQK